jgi:molybdate transport system substrate-binding protein
VRTCTQLLTLSALALALPLISFAQLNVITSGGFAAVYQTVIPEFQKTAGIQIITSRGASQGIGPSTIGAQLRNGLAADVVIMSKEGLRELIADNRINPATVVDLAQSPLGVAVRAGAPKPDIHTVEAFKQMVLRAKSINFVSTTGLYLTEKLFPKLGIDASGKVNGSNVTDIASGAVEIAIRPVSELINVPGVDFVGKVPDEIQFVSVFSAAILRKAQHPDDARRLIQYLSSDPVKTVIRKHGMEPPPSH